MSKTAQEMFCFINFIVHLIDTHKVKYVQLLQTFRFIENVNVRKQPSDKIEYLCNL